MHAYALLWHLATLYKALPNPVLRQLAIDHESRNPSKPKGRQDLNQRADGTMESLEAFERRADPGDREQQELLTEMRSQLKKMQEMTKDADPRLSFSTPEFKEAQRVFTDGFKKNFGRPVEWALVKEYPWSVPQLRKLDNPVDVHGQPWAAK